MIGIQTVFSWLKYFRGSTLATPVTGLRDAVVAAIQNQDLKKAYQQIEYLEACVGELEESVDCGDVWVELGMLFYQMGNLRKAEESWKKAISEYPECHECAVSRWLLGAVQWELDTSNIPAMNNWRAAISEFRNLAEEAEKKRLMEDRFWYDDRIAELEDSLNEQIAIKFA